MNFGWNPAPPEKLAKRLWLADYMDFTLQALPASVDHRPVGMDIGMLGNDTVGDCVIAAGGHSEEVADFYGLARPAIQVTTDSTLAYYSAITGYDPSDPNSDQGTDLPTFLSYWRKHGLWGDALSAYTAFDPKKPDDWRAVIDYFGVAFFGAWLPAKVVTALESGSVVDWNTTSDPLTYDAGHGIAGMGYDATGVWVATWGQFIHMTWAFAAKYVDEAYAPLLPSWASGKEPNALNVAQLEADAATIVAGGTVTPPTPTPPPAPPAPPVPPAPAPDPKGCLTAALGLLAAIRFRSNNLKAAIAKLRELEAML
jgi:hypothetical protein